MCLHSSIRGQRRRCIRDRLACAERALAKTNERVSIFEMCVGQESTDLKEILDRIALVGTLGRPLLITRHRGWYRLPAYFRLHTDGEITLIAGMNNLVDLFNPQHYTHLEGGVLEACGRLFKENVKVMVYPMRGDQLSRLIEDPVACQVCFPETYKIDVDSVVTAADVQVRPAVAGLFVHLRTNGFLVPITGASSQALACQPRTLAERIAAGVEGWEREVPAPVAKEIIRRKLWSK